MYFPHTRTSWDKHMFNGMPNSNFKIGLSLFGCAEKYTEQITHCTLVTICKLRNLERRKPIFRGIGPLFDFRSQVGPCLDPDLLGNL